MGQSKLVGYPSFPGLFQRSNRTKMSVSYDFELGKHVNKLFVICRRIGWQGKILAPVGLEHLF